MAGFGELTHRILSRLQITRWRSKEQRAAEQQRLAEERAEWRRQGVLKEGMPPGGGAS